MDDFLEVDELKKTIKLLNLDDLSVEDLDKYIIELEKEVLRVKEEMNKKKEVKSAANRFFK